uniref:Nuclear speckle splicing regulatory protein 1 n=1 Tax=Gouania willdenowi TaxID=441366 RepID=A0A8C5DHJ4_GOUWI
NRSPGKEALFVPFLYRYGLILPQKKEALKAALQRPSIFGDDSDDETSVGESLKREAIKKKMMKQTRLEMQKALDQDSTVYDYDNVYEDIQKQRLENTKKILGGADKQPKYIHQLMKAVEDRKKEQERRDERKIQKEREAEGEKFADKEAYVTSAYKQKLEEQKEEQEREKREAALEAALDVKKQKDLSGFYRHLLNQTVGEEAIPDRSTAFPEEIASEDAGAERTLPIQSPTSHDNIPSSSSDGEERLEKSGFSKPGGVTHSKRQYRQRSRSVGSEDDKDRERERDRGKHKKSHKDRGRDRERNERHGERRSDADRRKDRRREDDKSRGRRDAEREDRHRKRERSPRERERDSNEDRQKQRNPDQDRRKDNQSEEQKEKKKPLEKDTSPDEKVLEKKKTAEEDIKDDEQRAKDKEEKEDKASKFVKRSTEQTVSSARERYMARQMARTACKSYIEKEED